MLGTWLFPSGMVARVRRKIGEHEAIKPEVTSLIYWTMVSSHFGVRRHSVSELDRNSL
jgi:hypothetical protein